MFYSFKQFKQDIQLLIIHYQTETVEYNVLDIILFTYKLGIL